MIFNKNKTISFREHFLLFISLALMALILYTSATNPFSPMLQRSLVLLGVVIITVLFKPLKGRLGIIIDGLIIIGALLSLGYIIFRWKDLAYRLSYVPVTFEVILGLILIIILLELTRRSIGLPLLVIAALALLYARFGRYLPLIVAHKGYSFLRIISNQYITNVGIFGTMTGTLSTVIAPFVLFGAVLQIIGVGDLMVDTAQLMTKNGRGGPAKMAVIASALFGMVSGSSTSNVMTTGCTTITLMKNTGYKADFAGAVEAAASTGGQFMPPVMGVAAFLMSYVTGIPYIKIAIAAIIPAVFYFVSIFIQVDLEARRLDLRPLEDKTTKKFTTNVLPRLYLFLPFIVLVVLLLKNWSCAKAAFYSTVLTIFLGLFRKESRISWGMTKNIAISFGKSMSTVGIACAVSGIVIGALNLTGATLRLTYAFVALANGKLFLLLMLVALLCIILGMGLPTPAAYSVAAAFAAPALTQVGVSTLASHMFVLFYASLSSITPPVAIAAYAAASLSGASPMKTGWLAWRLALAGFIIPFMFVYGPALLIGEAPIMTTVTSVITGLIGVFLLSMATIGHFLVKITLIERLLLLIPACCLIHSGLPTDIIGITLGFAFILVHFLKAKRLKV